MNTERTYAHEVVTDVMHNEVPNLATAQRARDQVELLREQRDELAEALRELEPAALRLAQLTNLANKAPGAPSTEWNATRQAVDKARVKARAALAKLS